MSLVRLGLVGGESGAARVCLVRLGLVCGVSILTTS